MFILNWILDNLHHPWSSVITPYGAWFSYALASYLLYVFYLWASQKPKNAGLYERVRWLEYYYKLPIIGIKSKGMPVKTDQITTAEKNIYKDYQLAINNGIAPSKEIYEKYSSYVHYAGDTDQKLMTISSWIVVFGLGLLEMAVLVKLLIDLIMTGGVSENDAKLYGIVGGVVLGIISGLVVHKAAHDMYKKGKISTAYNQFDSQNGKRVEIRNLKIEDDFDNKLTDAQQLLSRADSSDVDDYGVYGKSSSNVITAIVLISLILIGSFVTRYVTYTSQFATVNCQVEYANDMDAQDICKQDNSLKLEQKENGLLPVLAGNFLFSILYVFLLFGLYIYSYKRSFLSGNSLKAFEKIKGNISGFDSIKEEIDRAIASADVIRGLYAEAYAKKRNNDLPDRYFIQYLSENCKDKNTCNWECVENYLRENKHV